jgi:hypothetical protein
MCSRSLIDANDMIMPPRRIATAQSFSERKICAAEKLSTGIVFRRVQKKKCCRRTGSPRRGPSVAVIGRRLNNLSFFERARMQGRFVFSSA